MIKADGSLLEWVWIYTLEILFEDQGHNPEQKLVLKAGLMCLRSTYIIVK